MKVSKNKLLEVIGCLVTADRSDLAEILAITPFNVDALRIFLLKQGFPRSQVEYILLTENKNVIEKNLRKMVKNPNDLIKALKDKKLL